MDPGRSQDRFLVIFDDFWLPIWRPFWITFWYFLSFEASNNRFGLHAWLLMIFKWKILWFLMSQPLKSIVNSSVFNRFHFLDFSMNLMISGTCLDLILITFGGLGALIWWFLGYWRLLEILMNFRVHPKLRLQTCWVVNWCTRAYCNRLLNTSLLTCKPSNTSLLTCKPSNSNCWWNIAIILEIWDQWMKK